MREVGRTRDKRRKPRREVVSSLSSVLPTSQVFYKITNERGTKTVFTYADVKWFMANQSARTI